MNPVLDRSMASLRSLAERVQEHAAPAAAAAQEHHGEAHAAGGHAEEWGTEVMMHHVVDSNIWEFGPFGEIHLPELPAFNVGGLEIDLSITKHVLFLMFAAIFTIATMFIAARSTERLERGEKAPGGLLNGIEAFYLYLRDDIVMANIGRGGERFVPLVITFFFFILYANLLGLIPFGATATGNIMVTAALAIIALVVIETAGFIALGPLGYAKTVFFLPPGLPGPLKPITLLIMAPVELIAKFSKIMALAIRLFANMTAGHFVILAFMGLILTYGSMVGQGVFGTTVGAATILGSMGLALFVMMLEIFIALLQAYIFAMLVSVFIGLIRHAH
ncbi:MAG: F0F1 ATP synthase subunit A [Gemmatimonadales bacterium]|nr:F0F1 ATP synthase subunit A [Gemmatimonadales bacterium]MYG47784.1 F0F1 ATP synthase subunit A [Gemmatimonadales bacterium]MYK01164.1 F0F1 ATP synthase subunit A [Candidatus Palauibacter ramosifaciens]